MKAPDPPPRGLPAAAAVFSEDAARPRAREGEDLSLTIPAAVLEAIVAAVTARVVAELDARPAVEPSPWMSIETAAAYLDCTVEAVRKMQARGVLPFYQEGRGCKVWFNRDELDAWMRASRRRRRPETPLQPLCTNRESV